MERFHILNPTQASHRGDGSGGLQVPAKMKRLLDQPGRFVTLGMGGQQLRNLYVKNSSAFDVNLLTWFGFCCYWAQLDDVKKAIESGNAPDIEGTETPYKFSYVTLVVAGSRRIRPLGGGDSSELPHLETLKYLLKCGAPVDIPDVVGYCALAHGTMKRPQIDLCRILLESGANPNQQDRLGAVPLLNAFMTNSISAIDLLMEFGADLNIPDADGVTPLGFQLRTGPEVAAAVQRWVRKRTGNEKPMDTNTCDFCRKSNDSLKICSKCHTVRYCSTACQRSHWKRHKLMCQPFDAAGNTVTLKPFYLDANLPHAFMLPLSKLTRDAMDIPSPATPSTHTRGSHVPRNPNAKNLIIKVQVPFDIVKNQPALSDGDLMVYTRKRNFVCRIRKQDAPKGYDRISQVVRTKGVGGAKAYFSAELKTKNELVVKVSEVLAEQPF